MTKPFKTQAEIYQYLLDGGKINENFSYDGTEYCCLKDGMLCDNYGSHKQWAFSSPQDWYPYKEPKKMKKIQVYGFIKMATGETTTYHSKNLPGAWWRCPELDRELEYEE